MNISDVHRGIQRNKAKRRLGRGPGSGRGKTAGRGHKGAGQRAGNSQHPAFQGGTMAMVRRVPKRGFHNKFAKKVVIVNVGQLESDFKSGADVNADALRAKGLVQGRYDELKVLGDGELTKKLKVSAHRFSKSALEKIQKAGGEAIVVPGKTPLAQKTEEQPQVQQES